MPGQPHQLEIIMSEGNVAADQLRLFIERIERLEEEKKGIADDIKDVYYEAKSTGYDTKTMRTIVRLRQDRKSVVTGTSVPLSVAIGGRRIRKKNNTKHTLTNLDQ